MAFKLLAFAAFVTVARAGIYGETYSAPLTYAAPTVAKVAYSSAPAVSYSSVSSPVAYAAPAVAKYASPISYSAPISYAAPAVAKVAYSSAPAVSYSSISSPVAYAAPAKYASPISYSAPISYAAQAPLSYAAPAHLSYAAPAHLSYAAPAPVAYAAPVAKAVYAEPSAPAHYDFGYTVNDPHTGDSKSQQESRRGDVVQGSYSLLESDGTKRTVDYTADAHNGFNAVVHKEPAAVAVKTVAPVAYAQPALKVASPVASYGYAASSYGYAAPSYYH